MPLPRTLSFAALGFCLGAPITAQTTIGAEQEMTIRGGTSMFGGTVAEECIALGIEETKEDDHLTWRCAIRKPTVTIRHGKVQPN